MKKRFLALLTTVSLALSLFTGTVLAKDVNDYGDVPRGAWFYEYVADVAQKELMTGLNENTFGPNNNLERGQFATIIYRMAQCPSTTYESIFSDVPDGKFYSLPITWANGTGIVTGYGNGIFGPSDALTREQMATILYRYANVNSMDTSAAADYSSFPDAGKVSSFATKAMSWAVGSGVISGDRGNLNPQGIVSRAVCATMIARFTGYTPPVAPEESSYQSILDEYSQRLRDAAPILVAEYNAECTSLLGDINALAELSNAKVGKLAEINVEGVGKMAELMYKNGDSYETYESWAGKLTDVYMEQATLITDAYMDSATR